MKLQNNSPISASSAKRATRPRSPASARTRAVISFGISRCSSDGSGSVPASAALRIEDVDQLARRILAGELEEDGLEPGGAGLRARAQVVHRTASANHAA